MARIRLGDLLVKAGLIDELQLQSALAHQRQWGGRLGDVLVNNGFLDEMMLWRGLSKQLGVPLVSLPELTLAQGIERQVPLDLCQKNSIFPIARDDKGLTLATSDPANIGGLDEISFRLGLRLRTVLAPDREVDWAIRRYLQGDPAPCPPPRLRRATMADAPAPVPSQAAPEMVIDRGLHVGPSAQSSFASVATSAMELAAIAAAAAATRPPTSMPPTQAPLSSPSSPSPPSVEAMLHETGALLRFVVEGCIQRGLFSREEFLNKLNSL